MRIAFEVWSRFSAWSKTTDCGPSTTSAVIASWLLVGGSHQETTIRSSPRVVGDGFSVQTLDNGVRAFGNRKYVFEGVPEGSDDEWLEAQ